MSLCYGMKDGELQMYYQEDEDLDNELDELEENEEDENSEEEGILLSEKHGVNPTMDVCMICGEVHQLILLGKLPNDEEAPKQICTGQVCRECRSKLEEEKQRLYIETKDRPTGRYIKVPDEFLDSEYLKQIGDQRVLYISLETFNKTFVNEQG